MPPLVPEQCAGFPAFRRRYRLFFHGLPGAIRAAAILIAPSRADFAMRGFAISFLTLARVASLDSFLVFLFIGPPR
jgi:hypothetical protein